MPLEANIWGTRKSSGAFSGLFHSRVEKALAYKADPFELKIDSSKSLKVKSINHPISLQIVDNFAQGIITENINRCLNSYRPFYYEKTGTRLTKPRFILTQNGLHLQKNPIQRPQTSPSWGRSHSLNRLDSKIRGL
jgi:hypothetical protein